jgi:hypothetical protein
MPSFTIESFEHRRLLAGNVVVVPTDPTVFIVGDAQANQVEVTVDTETGPAYRITGLHGTKVNGAAAITVPALVPRGFAIVTAGGDDVVRLHGPTGTFTNAITIAAGAGNDRVELIGGIIFGDVAIDTGGGNDLAVLGGISVQGNFAMTTGGGNDAVAFTSTGVKATGSALLTGGPGFDVIFGASLLKGDALTVVVDFELPLS